MPIPTPSLRDLRLLEAVARLQNISRAADELALTQGAVSRAIQRLESHFDRPMFVRTASGFMPTEETLRYLDAVRPALASLDAASAQMRVAGAMLRIATVPTLSARWLIPRLPAWYHAHPEVDLRFVEYRKGDIFADNRVDAAILWGEGQRPGLACDYLMGRECVAVCRPDLLTERQVHAPADLLDYGLLYHNSTPDSWAYWFAQAGIADAQVHLKLGFDQIPQLAEAAAAGLGIALLPACLIHEELETGRLVSAFPGLIPNKYGYYLCYPPEQAQTLAFRAFRDWLLAEAFRSNTPDLSRASEATYGA